MTILLIEDDMRIAEFVQRGLSDDGYGVTLVEDGISGLEAARSAEIDLIISEISLPRLDGKELCRRLRAENVNTPILFLSALDAVDDVVEGLRAGADDYMCKPFAFDELLARIEALGRRPIEYRQGSQKLKIADLILDPETHSVRRGDRQLTLTATEFTLLEYVMSHPKKVISQSQILANVWGLETDPLTNIVQVYISRLRQKIDGGEAVVLIHTIRGFGYQIAAPE